MHNFVSLLFWSIAIFFMCAAAVSLFAALALKRALQKLTSSPDEVAKMFTALAGTKEGRGSSLFQMLYGNGSQGMTMMGKTVKVTYDPVEGSVMEETTVDSSGNKRTRTYKQDSQTGGWVEMTGGAETAQAKFAQIDSGESDNAPVIEAEVVESGTTQQPFNSPQTSKPPLPPETPNRASGTKLCPHCSAAMNADDNFCISCGHAVGI